MTAEILSALLSGLPKNAEVVFVYDGQFRSDVRFVTYTPDGLVRLLSRREDANGHALWPMPAFTPPLENPTS